MIYSFQSNSMPMDVVDNLPTGGLQILSWFTSNVFNANSKEETHPYAMNVPCVFGCESHSIFGGN